MKEVILMKEKDRKMKEILGQDVQVSDLVNQRLCEIGRASCRERV